ncbi:dual specificity protein phosphatase 1-like [Bidens hawaiensis]|uniref:dual specificity protein phosphatase 1-like n=1 Tax=Bidens hawaiensis TaxID=980011 RepID=UPI004049DD0F
MKRVMECISFIAMDRFNDMCKEGMNAILKSYHTAKMVRNDRVPIVLDEGLFLGSVGAANNKRLLKRLNITHILTVASSIPPAYPNDFIYKVVDVHDREDVNIAQFFEECFAFIDEAKREIRGGVLVHCFDGSSTSVIIVVAFLMKIYGWSFSEPMGLVKRERSVAAPNSGFVLQLKSMEKSLLGKL